MKESGFARYLHSAVLINGAILVFGGNTHNDTSLSNGAKCFSADFLAYDIGMYCIFLIGVLNIIMWLSQVQLMWSFKVLIPKTLKLYIIYIVN